MYRTELSSFGVKEARTIILKKNKILVLDSRFSPRVEAAANRHWQLSPINVGTWDLTTCDQEVKQRVWQRRQGDEASSSYFSILHT